MHLNTHARLVATQLPRMGLLAALLCPLAAHAVVTSFETTDGAYANGTTVIGVSDNKLGGTWTDLFNTVGTAGTINASNALPASGSLALGFTKSSNTSALGAAINAANTSSLFAQAFTLNFSLNIGTISASTGSQVQLSLGQSTSSDGNHWTRFVYNNGTLQLVTGTGAATSDTAVNLGSYTSFSPLGSYINVSISIDPATHKYTNVSIAGTATSQNLTSAVLASNGGTVPWTSSLGNPSASLLAFMGSNDTGTVYFDNISVSAIPEPGSFALLAGGAIGFVAVSRRRRRA